MKNITVYKCTLVHVRKKHKRLIRARELRGKEREKLSIFYNELVGMKIDSADRKTIEVIKRRKPVKIK